MLHSRRIVCHCILCAQLDLKISAGFISLYEAVQWRQNMKFIGACIKEPALETLATQASVI
jgi:hypothetical protein